MKKPPETRKVRIVRTEPPRTTVLPDELLRELRRGAAAEPGASSPRPRRRTQPALPQTVALRPLRSVAPQALPRPRTRLLLAACLAALLLAALLALVTARPKRITARDAVRNAAPVVAAAPAPRTEAIAPTPAAVRPRDVVAEPIAPRPTVTTRRAASPRDQARDARALTELTQTAIDRLAHGDDRGALASYRLLAALVPAERAYTLVTEVLEQRLAARCGGPAASEAACAR